MKSAAEILAPALRRAWPRRSAFDWLVTTWPAIVGRRLAECTAPKSLREGVLVVAVTGKEWRVGLECADISAQLRDRVNVAWGGNLVRETQFAEAAPRGPRVPKAADNSYTPFVRKRAVISLRAVSSAAVLGLAPAVKPGAVNASATKAGAVSANGVTLARYVTGKEPRR